MNLREQLHAEATHGELVKLYFGPLPTGKGVTDHARLVELLHRAAREGLRSVVVDVHGALLEGLRAAWASHFYNGQSCPYPNREGPADYLRRFFEALQKLEPELKTWLDKGGSLHVEW